MMRLATPGARIAALIAFFVLLVTQAAGPAAAADETIAIGSATITVGNQATVAVRALNFHEPGLGAWSIDTVINPNVISVVGCVASDVGINLCNPDYLGNGNTVRVVGAIAEGVAGDTTLAMVTVRCESLGVSGLALTVGTLADAGLARISPNIVSGTVACVELKPTSTGQPPISTPPVEPTATEPVVVPATVAPAAETPGAAAKEPVCDDFATQADAQAAFDADPDAHAALDGDGDGIACEAPSGPSSTVAGSTSADLPDAGSGGPTLGGASLQDWLIAGLAGAGIAWLAAGLAGAGVASFNARNRRSLAKLMLPAEVKPPAVTETRSAVPDDGGAETRTAPTAAWAGRAQEKLQGIGVARMAEFGWWRIRRRRPKV